jgi:hypothetical protein
MSLPKIPPKQQMLLMGYISVGLSLMCVLFIAVILPSYLKLRHSTVPLSGREVSTIVLDILVMLLCIAAYSAIIARAVLRNRKYMMDEIPAGPQVDGGSVCAECAGTFKREDMIAVGEHLVCARCKPVFIQKLTEGASTNATSKNKKSG